MTESSFIAAARVELRNIEERFDQLDKERTKT